MDKLTREESRVVREQLLDRWVNLIDAVTDAERKKDTDVITLKRISSLLKEVGGLSTLTGFSDYICKECGLLIKFPEYGCRCKNIDG